MTDQQDKPPIRYPLFVAWRGINLRLTDNGVVPEAEGLRYMRDGREAYRPYRDIASVNLSMTALPRSAEMVQMTITFRNGMVMRVLNAGQWGSADQEQTRIYYKFKEDFHQRLVASGAARDIRFTTGVSELRSRFQMGTMVLGGLFFLGGPIIVFVLSRRAEALLVCLAGLGFLMPLLRSTDRNRPGGYDPRDPPDMLA